MLYALLLLGLLPALILSDVFSDNEDDEEPEDNATPDAAGTGDLLDLFGPVDPDGEDTGQPLQPDTGDDIAAPGDAVDPATVLSPDVGDESIVPGDEIDPSTVLGPDEADDLPPEAATLLQEFLAMQMPDPVEGAHDISEAEPDTGAVPEDTQAEDPDAGSDDDDDDDKDDDEESDALWMYADPGTPDGVVSVDAFIPGEDVLRIALDPDMIEGELSLDVSPTQDGGDGMVSVNGEVIALLRGAPGATPADVFVEMRRDLFL